MVDLVLGLDVSTTATKAILVDGSGAVRGIGTSEYGYETPRPLWSEQDPALWWTATGGAVRAALAAARARGLSPGRAAAEVAAALGRPRSEVYAVALDDDPPEGPDPAGPT